MSALAAEIYRQLRRHVQTKHSITYGELAALVSRKIPTHHRSPLFHAALGELTVACRAATVPCIASIVWSSATKRPSDGYYKAAHPRARTDQSKRAAWELEHAAAVAYATHFPVSL